MRPSAKPFLCLVLYCITALCLLGQPGQSQEQTPANSRIKELQQKRMNALFQAQTLAMKLFHAIRVETLVVYEINIELLRTICSTTDDQVAPNKSLDQLMEVAVELQNTTQARLENARGPVASVLMSKALVLAIQIEQEKRVMKDNSNLIVLQRKRLEVLRELRDSLSKLFNNGGRDFYWDYATNTFLLRAICESTDDRADLVKLLDRELEIVEKMRDVAQSRKEGARGTALPVSLDTACALAIQIEKEKLTTNDNSKIAELRHQRMQALTTVQELSTNLLRNARVDLENVCDTSLDLLRATIEAADSRDELIKSLEQLLENVIKMRDISQQIKEFARGAQIRITKSESLILAIQIEQEKLVVAK